jgi:hypothetical protein
MKIQKFDSKQRWGESTTFFKISSYQTDVSKKVETFIEKELNEKDSEQYISFSKYWISKGYTPLFEFISPDNQIVLDYKETKLICLGVRNNKYGNYLSHEDVKESCKEFGVHCVKEHDLGDNIDEIIKKIEEMEGIEGFVLKIEDGDEFYKIKCDWYRNLHKNGPKLMFGNIKEAQLWIYIINNELDDLTAILANDNPLRSKLEEYAELLWSSINKEAKKLQNIVEKAELKTNNYLKKHFQKFNLNEVETRTARLIVKGEDAILSLANVIKETIKNSKKIPIYLLSCMEIKPFEFDMKLPKETIKKTVTVEKKIKPFNVEIIQKTQSKTVQVEKSLMEEVEKTDIKIESKLQSTTPVKKKLSKKRRGKAKNIPKVEEKVGFEINYKK